MPQELLRDVLRSGDASGRARRRLSVLPVSIAVHAVAIGSFIVVPLLTGSSLPAIASEALPDYVPTVAPPPPPPSTPVIASAPRPLAPISAPDTLPLKDEPPPAPTTPGIEGGDKLSVHTGTPSVLSAANTGPLPDALPAPLPPTPKVVRVGGVIREPRKLVHVAPVYPTIAQQAQKEGTVTLEALLDVTGKVESVRVLRSEPLLDDAAVQAVKRWRYTPTELNGVPVPVLMTITVRFTLQR
jgi:periplasmic protein TonB